MKLTKATKVFSLIVVGILSVAFGSYLFSLSDDAQSSRTKTSGTVHQEKYTPVISDKVETIPDVAISVPSSEGYASAGKYICWGDVLYYQDILDNNKNDKLRCSKDYKSCFGSFEIKSSKLYDLSGLIATCEGFTGPHTNFEIDGDGKIVAVKVLKCESTNGPTQCELQP